MKLGGCYLARVGQNAPFERLKSRLGQVYKCLDSYLILAARYKSWRAGNSASIFCKVLDVNALEPRRLVSATSRHRVALIEPSQNHNEHVSRPRNWESSGLREARRKQCRTCGWARGLPNKELFSASPFPLRTYASLALVDLEVGHYKLFLSLFSLFSERVSTDHRPGIEARTFI